MIGKAKVKERRTGLIYGGLKTITKENSPQTKEKLTQTGTSTSVPGAMQASIANTMIAICKKPQPYLSPICRSVRATKMSGANHSTSKWKADINVYCGNSNQRQGSSLDQVAGELYPLKSLPGLIYPLHVTHQVTDPMLDDWSYFLPRESP